MIFGAFLLWIPTKYRRFGLKTWGQRIFLVGKAQFENLGELVKNTIFVA